MWEKYASTANLNRHVIGEHKGIRFPCNQCSYKCKDRSTLRKHEKSVHGRNKTPLSLTWENLIIDSSPKKQKSIVSINNFKDSLYSCFKCEKPFRDNGRLDRHILSVHRSSHYSCNLCPYKAKHPKVLRNHENLVHDDYRYCDKCDHNSS